MALAVVISLVLVFLLYVTYGFTPTKNIDISSFLFRKITNDSKIRQIVWLINNTKETHGILPIATTKVPSFVIDYQNAINPEFTGLPTFQNTRSTLIVIILNSIKLPPNDFGLLNFLTRIVGVEQRPKILIIKNGNSGKSCRKFLKMMWSKNFLDVTVLEQREKDDDDDDRNEKLTDDDDDGELSKNVMQRYFNPFRGRFTKRSLKDLDLFPDKSKNLHGHQMKVGFFHYPPYLSIVRNKSNGDVLRLEGYDYQLVRILAERMNFQILEVISNKTNWDVDRCEKEENTGLTRAVMFNEINFIGVQSGLLIVPCIKKLIKHIENNLGTMYISAVVPFLPSDDNTVSSVMMEFKLSFLLSIVSLLALTWLFPRVIKFERKNFQIVNLIGIMLGICVPSEPRRSAERIFFASTLITFSLYSSVIFSSFTSINLQKKSLHVIDSLNDLYSSNLTPVIHTNQLQIFEMLQDPNGSEFIRKFSISSNTDEECIDYLLKFKNVTCFMRELKANLVIHVNVNDYHQSVIHKVRENLSKLMNSLMCEPGFPYVTNFRKILIKLQESGIPNKWNIEYFGKKFRKFTPTEEILPEGDLSNLQIRQNMIFILVLGFTCSLLVFIAELLLFYAGFK